MSSVIVLKLVLADPCAAAPAGSELDALCTDKKELADGIGSHDLVVVERPGCDDLANSQTPGKGSTCSWTAASAFAGSEARVAVLSNKPEPAARASRASELANKAASVAAAAARAAAEHAESCGKVARAAGDAANATSCAVVLDEAIAIARQWESEAVSAIEPSDVAPGKRTQQEAYNHARSAREALERAQPLLRADIGVAQAKCRAQAAPAAPPASCEVDDEQRLLGRRRDTFDPTGLRAANEQLKAVGAGAIPGPVADLLETTAKLALKRAKRAALGFVHDELERRICELPKPGVMVDQDGIVPEEQLLPATCALVRDTALETLAKDPRRLQPALVADLVAVVAATAITQLPGINAQPAEGLRPAQLVDLAVKMIGRIENQQTPRPSHVDAQALLTAALPLRRQTRSPAVGLALDALVLYVDRQGRVDITTLIDEIGDAGNATAATRARAVEIALLGIRGLGLAHEPTPADERDAWVASVDAILQIAIESFADPSAKKTTEQLRALVVAVADENVPAAVSAATRLVATALPRACYEWKKLAKHRNKHHQTRDRLCSERALQKASALLSGVASYSATYSSAGRDEKSESELQAARSEALEDLVDAVTRRNDRHGEWVVSLGMPIGFATGYQWVRTRERHFEADGAATTEQDATFRKGGFMPPQLELPLGVGVQKLVGGRWRKGLRKGDSRVFFDGFHMYVSALDLGQFVAYKLEDDDDIEDDDGKSMTAEEKSTDAEISRPRWDSVFGPGVQLGWAFGRPDNMFVLAAGFRYAPTLFAESFDTRVNDNGHNPAGALRLGVSLVYYISLFDFN